ncbi:MAG: hypothetical protein AAFY71_07875 [Bacteroidota bacterium]
MSILRKKYDQIDIVMKECPAQRIEDLQQEIATLTDQNQKLHRLLQEEEQHHHDANDFFLILAAQLTYLEEHIQHTMGNDRLLLIKERESTFLPSILKRLEEYDFYLDKYVYPYLHLK